MAAQVGLLCIDWGMTFYMNVILSSTLHWKERNEFGLHGLSLAAVMMKSTNRKKGGGISPHILPPFSFYFYHSYSSVQHSLSPFVHAKRGQFIHSTLPPPPPIIWAVFMVWHL